MVEFDVFDSFGDLGALALVFEFSERKNIEGDGVGTEAEFI